MHSTYGNTEMKPSNSVDEFKLNELHSTNHTIIMKTLDDILFHSLTSLCSEASVDLLGQCWRLLALSGDGASSLYVQVISYLQEDQRSSTSGDFRLNLQRGPLQWSYDHS